MNARSSSEAVGQRIGGIKRHDTISTHRALSHKLGTRPTTIRISLAPVNLSDWVYRETGRAEKWSCLSYILYRGSLYRQTQGKHMLG